MKKDIERIIEIPQGIEISIDGSLVKVKGKLGETSKAMLSRKINLKIAENKVIITNKILKIVGSFSKYSPNPPQTPPILRLVSER